MSGPKQSVGRSIGSSIGGWVGDMAQKAISTITGLGDYQVKSNSVISPTNGPPQFMSGGGCVRIPHREFLGLVNSPGPAFNINAFPLNPFNATTFPWLSEIAGSFETFRIEGAVFEFKSTYGDAIASTNAALGSVILATQYNSTAPPFVTQIQMENYQYATSCKPSVSMIHPIECDPSQLPIEHLYVFNETATAADPRWTQLGVTFLATVGQQSAAVLGELWVSFDICFYQPKLLSGVPSNGLSSHFQGSVNGLATSSGLFPVGSSAGATPMTLTAGDLNLTFIQSSPGVSTGFAFPAGLTGTYQVDLYMRGNSALTITNSPLYNGGTPLPTNAVLAFTYDRPVSGIIHTSNTAVSGVSGQPGANDVITQISSTYTLSGSNPALQATVDYSNCFTFPLVYAPALAYQVTLHVTAVSFAT